MDFTVYFNLTAPYANGLGRRTVWRAKARVEAGSSEEALRSQNFESTGDVYIHDDNRGICILGGGWEMHINCPTPETEFCRACGSPKGHTASYCRDCCPRPSHADNVETEELKPRVRRASKPPIRGKLQKIDIRDRVRRKRAGKKNKKLVASDSVDVNALNAQLQKLFPD